MSTPIRWGILGPGKIAHKFAEDFKHVPQAQIVAVASRSAERAKAFAQTFNIPNVYDSYQALASSPEVDVIYIATPHSLHFQHMMLCLQNDKHVLCEKPFTLNARQARTIIDLARKKQRFVMEAMWTLFLPVLHTLKNIVYSGQIGQLRMISAHLSFAFPFDPQHRVFNPHLGGGALLDLGVYPLTLIYHLMGVPDELSTLAILGQTKVDEQSNVTFKYQDGRMAHFYSSLRNHSPSEAIVMGNNGFIRLHGPLYRPEGLTIHPLDAPVQTIAANTKGHGYHYQVQEVIHCLQTGKKESKIVPHEHTLTIMELMDAIRAQWGLQYPEETTS